MKYGSITVRDLMAVWRIVLAVVACQLIGSAVSSAFPMHHDAFANFHFGGAAGALPGFVVGVVWQFSAIKPVRRHIEMACFLGILSFLLTFLALEFDLPRTRMEMQNLENIRRLSAENLQSIEVFDRYGRKRVAQFRDTESLASFAEGIADAMGYSPNHPHYTNTWYVVVGGTTRHEFELHLCAASPESVTGDVVVKVGDSTSYQGPFESRGLRPWVDARLMDGNAQKALHGGEG